MKGGGLDKNTLGLTTGILLALAHAIWSTLIAFGLAKPFMDWVLSLHSLSMDYTVNPFDILRAAILIVLTFVIGYILGWVFAAIWNRVKKK